jgi:hypothetical protein
MNFGQVEGGLQLQQGLDQVWARAALFEYQVGQLLYLWGEGPHPTPVDGLYQPSKPLSALLAGQDSQLRQLNCAFLEMLEFICIR